MKQLSALLVSVLWLTACSQGASTSMNDSSTMQTCYSKPNCVSSIETRPEFMIEPFVLMRPISIEELKPVALSLKRSSVVKQTNDYLHIECSSAVFGFVDDLEITLKDDQLVVRSRSRSGYYDFGVNRKRSETLRQKLLELDIIQAN